MYSILKGDEKKKHKKVKGVKNASLKAINSRTVQGNAFLEKSSYGMEWTFFEVKNMRFTVFMLTKYLFGLLIQSDG